MVRFSRLSVTVLLSSTLAVGAVIGVATPAQAHNYLVSSTPPAGSTLTQLPDDFAITTNDALLDLGAGAGAGGFALQVVGADGLYYGDGCVAVADSTMTAIPALGPAGEYTLTWQVVSADGHPVSDQFTFAWAPTDGSEPSAGSESAPVCDESAEEPIADAETSPSPAPSANDAAENGQASGDNDARVGDNPGTSGDNLPGVLWAGGVAAVLAIGAVVAVVRRRRKP